MASPTPRSAGGPPWPASRSSGSSRGRIHPARQRRGRLAAVPLATACRGAGDRGPGRAHDPLRPRPSGIGASDALSPQQVPQIAVARHAVRTHASVAGHASRPGSAAAAVPSQQRARYAESRSRWMVGWAVKGHWVSAESPLRSRGRGRAFRAPADTPARRWTPMAPRAADDGPGRLTAGMACSRAGSTPSAGRCGRGAENGRRRYRAHPHLPCGVRAGAGRQRLERVGAHAARLLHLREDRGPGPGSRAGSHHGLSRIPRQARRADPARGCGGPAVTVLAPR